MINPLFQHLHRLGEEAGRLVGFAAKQHGREFPFWSAAPEAMR
jgi:hypothetical protein